MATEPQVGDKLHNRMLSHINSWVSAVKVLHTLMRRDYEFVNGQQAKNQSITNVKKTGRELLFFNEIRPQFELLSGHRSSQQLDYVAAPRSREDKRLGTLVSTLLKATYDVIKKDQVVRQVGDDGDICGLGATYSGHTFDFSDDIVWGDIFLERISPFAVVFDAWGTAPQYQDGKFFGHRWWLHEDDYKKKYPNAKVLPPVSEWAATLGQLTGVSETFNPAESLEAELLQAEKKHVAVFRLYYKDDVEVYFIADSETGDVYSGGTTEKEAKSSLKKMLEEKVDRLMGKPSVTPIQDGQAVMFSITDAEGNPMLDETGQQPAVFDSEDDAKEFIKRKKVELAGIVSREWKVWKRKRHVIKWAEFSAFEVLDKGSMPVTTQKYPYRLYVSRQLGDDVEDIEGVVRQVIDRQKEITKRYNHLADHLAHSAHSGFFNRKGEGCNPKLLQLMGTQPGIVAEYNSVMPTKIEPSQIPIGHFTLLNENIGGMQRSTGINAEMLGLTSSSTVSGEAITARQRGGIAMQFGRLQNYTDFERELAEQILWHIQNAMPVEKMRRIIGVWEAKTQSSILGQSSYLHPVTGEPATENELLDLLSTVKNVRFDLTMKPMPVDQTVREKQFQTALQMMQLITQTGRPIGPTTFKEMANLSDLPERLVASLEADAQAAAQAAQAEAQGAAIGDAIKSNQARGGPNV